MNDQFSITSRQELDDLLNAVDLELAEDDVPIPARPMKACVLISGRNKLGMHVIAPYDHVPDENRYDGAHLTWQIHRWFERRYGERLFIDFSLGGVAINVRGDAYKITIPRVWGQAHIVVDPRELYNSVPLPTLGVHEPITINVLRKVEGLTPEYASSLTDQELGAFDGLFTAGLKALGAVDRLRKLDLMEEAKADLRRSVDHLVAHPSEIGQSRWSSLQATEKILKAAIRALGGTYSKTHDLVKLGEELADLGLYAPPDLLKVIQCDPSVRYGEGVGTLKDAITVNQRMLWVCGFNIAVPLERRLGIQNQGR